MNDLSHSQKVANTTDWQSLCQNLGVRSAAECSQIQGLTYPTHIREIDQLLGGGLPCQALSEIITAQPSCGSTLLLHRLLESAQTQAHYTALVDACDRFAPDQFTDEPTTLEHLYWVRCRGTEEALRVSDILSNDRNFALLLIDLRDADQRTLSAIPGNRWYRLQRAIRKNGGTAVALTAQRTIPAASVRLQLSTSFPIAALEQLTDQLADQLPIQSLGSPQNSDTLRRFA